MTTCLNLIFYVDFEICSATFFLACGILPSHIFKGNNILFLTALRVVTEQEWVDARREFDEIGYCCFTPVHLIAIPEVKGVEKQKPEAVLAPEGLLQFETGTLSKDEIEAILDTLPVDITFVNKEDTVRYFSKSEGRIFVRTKAVIGRKVQQCHPQKGIHVVNKILESFKSGKKDVAEFWIQKGRDWFTFDTSRCETKTESI